VHTALKPLYSPADGWVTTTFAAVKTFPPPTVISLAEPSAVPLPPAAALDDVALVGVPDVAPSAGGLYGTPLTDELGLELGVEEQPASRAAPARPAPASAARRVDSPSRKG
jgi:hypothetical protein